MQNVRQRYFTFLWQVVPGVTVILSLPLMYMLFGYHSAFYQITPLLPLLVACCWLWHTGSLSLLLALFLAGLLHDSISGTPLGLSALIWVAVAWVFWRWGYRTDEDESFISRWNRVTVCLIILTIAEWVSSVAFASLTAPATSSLLIRLMVMVLLYPSVHYLLHGLKRILYRRMWVYLPPEMRVV